MIRNVPTMTEVAKLRGTNGFNLISTFSGCGGACLGFEMAGYDVLWANEFVEAARDTYEANHPGVILNGEDIRSLSGQDILDAVNLEVGEADLLEGSPPCSSFSIAGRRHRLWGVEKTYSDTTQVADDLFFEYSRIVREIQPKVFVAENVAGLVRGRAIGYFNNILRDLRGNGYTVEAKLLDASYLGIPQARQRLIFVGVRNDLVKKFGVKPVFPKPEKGRGLLGDVIEAVPEDFSQSFKDEETGYEIGLGDYAIGQEWDKMPIGGYSKFYSLKRPPLDRPAPTVTAMAGQVGAASIAHPYERRKFNLKELRALQSFPEDFILTGNYTQRVERIGRSVPPLMSKAIGEVIRTEILEKVNARSR
jgi:DNA (cytosine-5)-methyltransferase 1